MRLKIGNAKKNNAQISDIDPSIRRACTFTVLFTILYLFGVFIQIIYNILSFLLLHTIL